MASHPRTTVTVGGPDAPESADSGCADAERPPGGDDVDAIVEFWCRANPAADPLAKGVALRLRRANHLYERAVRQELGGLGLEVWEVETLMTLRRAPGRHSSAGTLAREANVTSGAMTNRLGRLEARGWVRREVDPSDRRQVQVVLTAVGSGQADRILAAKTAAEERFLAGVDRRILGRLSEDLRALLAVRAADGADPPPG